MSDWNTQVIDEFRAHDGRVGGPFEGAPMLLIHHRGRRSGNEHITPTMYLPDGDDPDVIYVFASKGGAPAHPDWYLNLVDAGTATVERGVHTYDVTVDEVTGSERDHIYREQSRLYPAFGEYEDKVAGVRVIPVLALRRVEPATRPDRGRNGGPPTRA